MNKFFSLGLIVALIAVSCSDPNTIGLEVQPTSDNIIISDIIITLIYWISKIFQYIAVCFTH